MEITRLDTHQKIIESVQVAKVPFIFFATPEMLNTFFNKENFALYSIRESGCTYIFIQKLKTKELRFLFCQFPETVTNFLKDRFNPPYIAYNELLENPQCANQLAEIEVIVDLEKYISLENKSIRKQYHQAQKYNKLIFKEFKNIPKADLELFWIDWAKDKQSKNPNFNYTLENDRRFFDLYKDVAYFGIAAYDMERLVGYSIGIKYNTDKCISAFNKCLRGYRNLGLQISIEKAHLAFQQKNKYMNVGTINNDFKKQFLSIAATETLYAYELFREESFKTKTENGYTGVLFW